LAIRDYCLEAAFPPILLGVSDLARDDDHSPKKTITLDRTLFYLLKINYYN